MSTQFPESVYHATVKGQIITAEGDTPADPDQNPDKVPAVGTVTFTATASRLVDITSKAIIAPKPITVTLDDEGRFEVSLIANENPNFVPFSWGYMVSFDLEGVLIPSYPIQVRPGETKDLTDEFPVSVPTDHVDLMRGERGPAGAGVLFIEDGSEPPVDFIGLVVRPISQEEE